MQAPMSSLRIADRTFASRLLTGTGKYASAAQLRAVLDASGAEVVTMAIKRVRFGVADDGILSALDPQKHLILPNTSGVRTAKEAIFAAELAREALGTSWLKLEIHPDPKYLMPDPVETLEACRELVKKGFTVLPYIHADPVSPSASKRSAPPRSCRSVRRSVPTVVSFRAISSASSSSRPAYRSSSTPASAPLRTPPKPLSSARMPSW